MEDGRIHVSPERLQPLLYEGRTFKSADDFSLTKEDIEVAFLELHETERVRTSALNALKDKINCDQEFRYRTDENFLLRFLRYSKFDVDKAYGALRKFYNFRKNHPNAFSLEHLEQVLNTRFLTYLPYRDEDNGLIFWVDFRNWNIDEWTLWDIVSAYHVLSEVTTINPSIQIRGVNGIWDMRGFSLKNFTHVLGSNLFILVKMLQESYPWRLRKIIVLHENYFLQASYNKLRYLLKKKIRDRIVFLRVDDRELHQYYNPAILPKQYGGTLEEKDCYVTQHIMENMDYIMYDRAFGHV